MNKTGSLCPLIYSMSASFSPRRLEFCATTMYLPNFIHADVRHVARIPLPRVYIDAERWTGGAPIGPLFWIT